MDGQDQASKTKKDYLVISNLLREVVNLKASDLHIQVGLPPMIRSQNDGSLLSIGMAEELTVADVEALVLQVVDDSQKNILIKNKEVDFGFSFQDIARFRVNAFYEKGQPAMSMRLIPPSVPTLEQLQLPPVIKEFAKYTQGLVLFCGPTGSGKSSSLAALINAINNERKERIVTIEDPIEFVHNSKRSIIIQREVHFDTFSFAAALRSVLRQDPDVVLVGELRDLETISSAITTAETGHLVFGTLHTNSAAQTINRLIDVFPPHQQPQIRSQLSSVLKAICVQKLIESTRGNRVCACEILLVDFAVGNLIREGKVHQIDSVIQNNAGAGMQGMDDTILKMVQEGTISYENAVKAAHNPTELAQKAKNVGVV